MTINRAANKVPPTGTRWLRLSREPNPKGQPADSQQRCSDKNSFSSWLRLCAQDDKPRKAVRHLRTSPRNKRGRKNLNDGQTYRCTCEPRPQTSHPFALSPFFPSPFPSFPTAGPRKAVGTSPTGPLQPGRRPHADPRKTYTHTDVHTYKPTDASPNAPPYFQTFTPSHRRTGSSQKSAPSSGRGVLDP